MGKMSVNDLYGKDFACNKRVYQGGAVKSLINPSMRCVRLHGYIEAYMYLYVCMYMYICMYVCMYVCLSV